MSHPTSIFVRSLRVIRLLITGRPLLAAQQSGVGAVRLERFSRVAGQQGGPFKRGARLSLYLVLRVGRRLPGSASLVDLTQRISPGLHDAVLKRYIAYSSNAGDWQLPPSWRRVRMGAHEAAVLRRLQRWVKATP